MIAIHKIKRSTSTENSAIIKLKNKVKILDRFGRISIVYNYEHLYAKYMFIDGLSIDFYGKTMTMDTVINGRDSYLSLEDADIEVLQGIGIIDDRVLFSDRANAQIMYCLLRLGFINV